MYTLSSPTVLATDAACHPAARDLLGALSATFRLTDAAVTHLGLAALDAPPGDRAAAWRSVEEVDARTRTTPALLRDAAHGGPGTARTLARSRLGRVADVVRLVTREAAAWPGAPGVAVAGGDVVPAPAAAAAGVVGVWWASPDLAARDALVLGGPWHAALGETEAPLVPAERSHGPRADAVADLCAALVRREVTLDRLARVGWPPGRWADAMHAGAWAAYGTGRLHAQLVAVLDVTAALVGAEPDPDPVLLRAALPALHALTVAAVVGDVLDAEPLAELHLGAAGL
ncbi:hypothetical protein ACWFNE_12020 [Cellulomonas sp. NPDC055163]